MKIIAAMTLDGVIGKDNGLPWKIPEDLKIFKELTLGNTVVMGHKTFRSLGYKPLLKRANIVLSRDIENFGYNGVTLFDSLDEALSFAENCMGETFVIGGASVYEQALPLASDMYLSLVLESYEGDTYFPEFSGKEWELSGEDTRYFDEFIWTHWRRR